MNTILKKAAALSAAAIMLGSSADAARFGDIETHWAREYIDELSERGIVSGMDDGLFHPDESVTSEQFTVMAVRGAVGTVEPSSSEWSSGYLDYAAEKGITDDYDILNKTLPIERRAAARIAHRTLLTALGEPDETDWGSASVLTDLYACHTCVIHIAQMYAKGIMRGRTDTFFDNYGQLTRAEAAAVIVRMLDPNKRELPETVTVSGPTEITPEVAAALLKSDPAAVLCDVRTAEEYAEGHLEGSVNLPLESLNANPYAVSRSRSAPVILYCQKGYKSSLAADILIKADYTSVYTLPGLDTYDYELIK